MHRDAARILKIVFRILGLVHLGRGGVLPARSRNGLPARVEEFPSIV